MSRFKTVLFISFIILIAVFFYFSLWFTDALNVSEVEIIAVGSSSLNPESVKNIINSVIGKNMVRLSSRHLISELSKIDVVKNVEIKKKYPSVLSVSVDYGDYLLRLKSAEGFYIYGAGKLSSVDPSIYNFYSEVCEVESTESYIRRLMSRMENNGNTSDLDKITELSTYLYSNRLSAKIVYEDSTATTSLGFGTLDVLLKNDNVTVMINSPISVDRLKYVLDEIGDYGYNPFGSVYYVDSTRLEQVQNLVNRGY